VGKVADVTSKNFREADKKKRKMVFSVASGGGGGGKNKSGGKEEGPAGFLEVKKNLESI